MWRYVAILYRVAIERSCPFRFCRAFDLLFLVVGLQDVCKRPFGIALCKRPFDICFYLYTHRRPPASRRPMAFGHAACAAMSDDRSDVSHSQQSPAAQHLASLTLSIFIYM